MVLLVYPDDTNQASERNAGRGLARGDVCADFEPKTGRKS